MNAIWPFLARPNGCGTWRRDPAISPTATSAATIRARATRSGTSRTRGWARSASCMGSHLSESRQAGSGRARAVRVSTPASRCSGSRTLRVRVQPGGEEEVELVGLRVARGHAGLPPRTNGCRASESSAARMVCSPDGALSGRSPGNAEDLRGVIERIAQVVVQDDHRSLVGIEPSEDALELVPIGSTSRFKSGCGASGSQLDVDLDGPPPSAAARLAIARVDKQPVEPGLETVGVAQAVDVAPGGHEGLLGRVLCRGLVTQDQPGDDEKPADRDARQLCERVVIACHRPLHEIPMHRASRCARPGWSRYNLMSRRAKGQFPNCFPKAARMALTSPQPRTIWPRAPSGRSDSISKHARTTRAARLARSGSSAGLPRMLVYPESADG